MKSLSLIPSMYGPKTIYWDMWIIMTTIAKLDGLVITMALIQLS